jgi:hypothetical protein
MKCCANDGYLVDRQGSLLYIADGKDVEGGQENESTEETVEDEALHNLNENCRSDFGISLSSSPYCKWMEVPHL